ncbi:MAG: hypothetical protein CL482_05035 [Acidobacteria bacterium]|nr:hypothetical protein [Acidobacteriota bacterium]
MTTRSARSSLGVCLCLLALSPGWASGQEPGTVELLVRVFDGLQDVTADCRISVYAATSRETAVTAEPDTDGWSHAEVPAGFYDLQVASRDANGVIAITWAEQRSVLQYSDEAGQHREIINVQPGFGALLVQPPAAWIGPDRTWRVGAFLHGGIGRAEFAPTNDGDATPRVFILPGGRYDLTAQRGAVEVSATDIEVPAGHTRLTWLPAVP